MGFVSPVYLLNPEDILEIPGIYLYPGGLGIFIPGIFRGWGFFRGIGYPTKKPPPVTNEIKFIYLILIDFSQ